jgi:hypothetical protein
MPKASKETASETIALDGLEVQLEHLDGGYSVCFESHTADADLEGLFRGLPDDRCQLPRWGYVINGKVAFRLADREETYQAGDLLRTAGPRARPLRGGRDRRVQPDGRPRADDPRGDREPARSRRRSRKSGWDVTDVAVADTEPDALARLFTFDERFYRLRRNESTP